MTVDRPEAPRSEVAPPTAPAAPKAATLPQIVGAVFWSFFGVRRGKHMQRDAVTIKPLQVVVVGIILAAVFVFTLLGLVRLILSNAS